MGLRGRGGYLAASAVRSPCHSAPPSPVAKRTKAADAGVRRGFVLSKGGARTAEAHAPL